MGLPPSAVSRACAPSKSRHFFSAFHRYISTTPRAQSNVYAHAWASPRFTRACHLHKPLQPPYRQASSTSTPNQQTHYTLFPQTLPRGPPPSGPFDVDTRILRREFLQLQARAHPDRHAGPDKARAEGTSALINEAYRTLSSPLLRAQYLLSLNGIDIAEDETAKIDDEELLMEVLEAREVIEGAEDESELEPVLLANEGRIAQSEIAVRELCERGDWQAVKDEAVRLRYWINIQEALKGWEKGKPVVIHH